MKKSANILHFIRHIVKNRRFCTRQMAQTLGTSDKTIQRYIKEVEEFFGIRFLTYEKGCYYLPDTSTLRQILIDPKDVEDFERVFDLLALADTSYVRFLGLEDSLAKKLLKDDARIYKLKAPVFEELKQFHLLKDLKRSIKDRRYIDIQYHSDRDYFYKEAKPLRILFAEGNWYLAALTDDSVNNGFKFLRINFIQDIEILPHTFQRVVEAERFIEEFQSLFSAYLEPSFEVRVRVDEEVARHFRTKKFLPSQRILEDRGDLIISYTINNENEILLLAKRWMPHMRILTPDHIQHKLIQIAKNFLNDIF